MADKIFRVNMTTLTTSIEEVPADWAGHGGRGLTSTIVAAEVEPTCHPLGPNNKLVFAPGLLSGTSAANSGRLSIGGKSPLTGTIKEANSGGNAAQYFARCGIKAMIIEGQPPGRRTQTEQCQYFNQRSPREPAFWRPRRSRCSHGFQKNQIHHR